jgi:putative membrane protein
MADEHRGRDSGDTARIVVAVVIAAALIAFVVDNVKSVKVGFVFTDREIPLIFVLIATALLGVILDRLVQYAARRRR